jgi:hypothetical protein
MTAPRAAERGSALIEAIVSSAIVAIVLGMAFQVIGETAARQRMDEQRRAAVLVAQSELAATGTEIPVQQGESAGLSGPFAWRVAIEPYGGDVAPSTAGVLMRVTVAVSGRQGGPALVTLHSLRLAQPD